MNLILLYNEDFIDNDRVIIHDRRYEHACQVLRVTHGKTLQVGLLNGHTGSGIVLFCGDSRLEMKVVLDQPPPSPLPVHIILALPRPKVLKRTLLGITSMGVKRITLINSWRVDKSYWQSPALEATAIREQLILGLEQARDTVLPEVLLQPRFKPFVEDVLPELIRGTCAMLAHPGSSLPCPANLGQAATLAIGPEGGFTDYELEKLVEAGLTPIHLGQRPLRVETAVPALIGRLFALT